MSQRQHLILTAVPDGISRRPARRRRPGEHFDRLARDIAAARRARSDSVALVVEVIPAQRWGVPAGAPTGLRVHVKNGWLPRDTHGWRIHSIGAFTSPHSWYTIVVLTEDNPAMDYGVTTIEDISRVIHRDLNPGATAVIGPSEPSPSWGVPDERLPALPGIP